MVTAIQNFRIPPKELPIVRVGIVDYVVTEHHSSESVRDGLQLMYCISTDSFYWLSENQVNSNARESGNLPVIFPKEIAKRGLNAKENGNTAEYFSKWKEEHRAVTVNLHPDLHWKLNDIQHALNIDYDFHAVEECINIVHRMMEEQC